MFDINYDYRFNFRGNQLISSSVYDNGIEYSKTELNYDGNNVHEVNDYSFQNGNWVFSGQDQFFYVVGKLDNIINYNGELKQTSKRSYIYSGEKVIEIHYYGWIDNSWEQLQYQDDYYDYNNEGLLVLENTKNNYFKYIYEVGRGNFNIWWDDGGASTLWDSVNNYLNRNYISRNLIQ